MSTMNWEDFWRSVVGLPAWMPQWMVALIALFAVYLGVIFPFATVLSYLDRKLGADFQARVGPNRAGPAGVFQPAADLLKLLQKEARQRWSWREGVWLGVHTLALYSTVAILPLGSMLLLVNTEMSAFLPFWSILVLALGTMLLGINQDSVPGWFGGIRIAAQTLSASFSALIALLCVGVHAGSFRWSAIAEAQGFSPLKWTVFSNPFEFLAFSVFVLSGMVLLEIPPLDGGLSLGDIHGGVASHLYGRRLSLFKVGRFYGFFLWSVISIVLFLGAWNLPHFLVADLAERGSLLLLQAIELFWLLSKTVSLMLLIVWAARVSPRLRVDQITDMTWKNLSPLSLFALMGSALWAGWRVLS